MHLYQRPLYIVPRLDVFKQFLLKPLGRLMVTFMKDDLLDNSATKKVTNISIFFSLIACRATSTHSWFIGQIQLIQHILQELTHHTGPLQMPFQTL